MLGSLRLPMAVLALSLGVMQAVRAETMELTKASYPEGPIWQNGKLYYVEYSTNRLMVWDRKKAAVFWEKPGCGHSGMIPYGKDHFLVSCYDSSSVEEVDAGGKEVHRFTADDSGASLSAPNDFFSDGKGGIYFTGSGDTKGPGRVFHLSADGKSLRMLADNIPGANGIAVSKDGKLLLVAQTREHQIMGFPINADGSLGERSVWAKLEEISPDNTRNGPDGLKVGPDGNVYIAQNGAGRVLVADMNKKLVRKIDFPTPSLTNMEFGPNGSLFITGLFQNKDPYPGAVYHWTP